MNKAFKNVVAWYFRETGISQENTVEVLGLIEAGLKAEEADTATILISLLQKAEALARDDGNETVLELVDIGKKLVVAESSLDKGKHLIAIRTMMDMPPDNPIANRIRSFKIGECAKALKDW